ncbi:MAG: hypothetical protein Q9169_002346, partial [Polycauliona sp. 2 TL-2023]
MSVLFKSPIGFTLNLPSAAKLESLKKIAFSDLKVESTSQGSYLLVKTTSLQKKFVTFHDEKGDQHKVRNYLQDGRQFVSEIYANAKYIVLKEPFCKEMGNGKPVILILHLSDILVLQLDDPMLPPIWHSTGDKSALQLKKTGNKHIREGEPYEAIDCFNRGLACTESTDFVETLRLNRSQARLAIESYEAALDDAQFIISGWSKDKLSPEYGKALLSCARALYAFRRFRECLSKLQEYCELYPNDELAVVEHERCKQRVEEFTNGSFDFAGWVADVAQKVKDKQPPLIDAAPYHTPVAFRQSVHGYGLFTARDVEAGDLLLCEKAFVCAFDIVTRTPIDRSPTKKNRPSSSSRGKKPRCLATTGRATSKKMNTDSVSLGEPIDVRLQLGTLHKVHRNPGRYLQPFLSLDGGTAQTAMISPGVLDSTLNQYIVEKNKFTSTPAGSLAALHHAFNRPDKAPVLPEPPPKDGATKPPKDRPKASVPAKTSGLWLLASRIKHSCLPNISRSIVGDMMIIRASTSMAANTEILDSYSVSTMPYPIRRSNLKSTYGFVCQCPACKMDQTVSSSVHIRRESLSQSIFFNTAMATTDSWNEVGPALEKLLDTYSSPPSESLRLSMLLPLFNIARALFSTGQAPVAVIYFALSLLQESEFTLSIGYNGDGFVVEEWGLMTQLVPEVLWMMRETVGKGTLNWKALDCALRKAYLICNGEDASYESCYANPLPRAPPLRSSTSPPKTLFCSFCPSHQNSHSQKPRLTNAAFQHLIKFESHLIIPSSHPLFILSFIPFSPPPSNPTNEQRELTQTTPTGGKGGKGLGKGGAKRHRKILRDNIQGITKPAIRRLARRGGVKRISASMFISLPPLPSIQHCDPYHSMLLPPLPNIPPYLLYATTPHSFFPLPFPPPYLPLPPPSPPLSPTAVLTHIQVIYEETRGVLKTFLESVI